MQECHSRACLVHLWAVGTLRLVEAQRALLALGVRTAARMSRARVDHDSAGCVQHGWARSSAALVTEVPQEGRTSVGRSRRARDVIPEFSDFSRSLSELRLQHAGPGYWTEQARLC